MVRTRETARVFAARGAVVETPATVRNAAHGVLPRGVRAVARFSARSVMPRVAARCVLEPRAFCRYAQLPDRLARFITLLDRFVSSLHAAFIFAAAA